MAYSPASTYGNSAVGQYNGAAALSSTNSYIPASNGGQYISSYIKEFSNVKPSIFSKFFSEETMPLNMGKEFRKGVLLPVYDNKNIGGAGVGHNFEENVGLFYEGGAGLNNGEPLRTKKFSYYIGNRRFDVNPYSTNVFKESTIAGRFLANSSATFAVTYASFADAASDFDKATFSAGATNSVITKGDQLRVADDINVVTGYLGVFSVLTSSDPIQSRPRKIDIHHIVGDASGALHFTLVTAKGIKATTIDLAIDANGYLADVTTAKEIVVGSIKVGSYTVAKGSSTLDNIITITGNDMSDNFTAYVTNVTSSYQKEVDAYLYQFFKETYNIYSIGGANHSVKFLTEVTTTSAEDDIVSDPYLTAALAYAKNMGYMDTLLQSSDDISKLVVPLATTSLDTVQIIDSRKFKYNSNLNMKGSIGYEDLNTYSAGVGGLGKLNFGHNLAGLVNIRNVEVLFAVFQDRPYGNAGGTYSDYHNIVNHIPYIGENTGVANVVSFNQYWINATVFRMGRMFKVSKEDLLFGNLGLMDKVGNTSINKQQLMVMTDGLYDLIARDKEIAQQLDIINNAGIVFYAGGASSMKGITKPLTYNTLRQAAKRLTENLAEPHTDRFSSNNSYGSVAGAPAYFALTSHNVIDTLRGVSSRNANNKAESWVPAEYYSHTSLNDIGGSKLTQEMGRLGSFRFIQMHPGHSIIYDGNGGLGGGKPGKNDYYDSEGKVREFADYEEASKEGFIGRVTDDFETDANGNLILHMIYVIGKDAISTIKLGSDASELQVNTRLPLLKGNNDSYPDSSDPYGNKGFVAASWYHGSIATHPDRILKILTPVKR